MPKNLLQLPLKVLNLSNSRFRDVAALSSCRRFKYTIRELDLSGNPNLKPLGESFFNFPNLTHINGQELTPKFSSFIGKLMGALESNLLDSLRFRRNNRREEIFYEADRLYKGIKDFPINSSIEDILRLIPYRSSKKCKMTFSLLDLLNFSRFLGSKTHWGRSQFFYDLVEDGLLARPGENKNTMTGVVSSFFEETKIQWPYHEKSFWPGKFPTLLPYYLTNLASLTLSHSETTEIPCSLVYLKNTLRFLDFSHNEIKRVPSWLSRFSLYKLDLSDNRIRTLPEKLFAGDSPFTEYLFLAQNDLSDLPEGIKNSELKWLDVSGNKNLRLEEDFFENLCFSDLHSLNIAYTDTVITPTLVRLLLELEIKNLNLSGCPLEDSRVLAPFLDKNSSLQELHLDDMELNYIPTAVKKKKTLGKKAKRNFIDSRNNTLRILSLAGNNLGWNAAEEDSGEDGEGQERHPLSALKKMAALEVLDLSGNGFGNISRKYLPSMMHLNLSDNRFERFPKVPGSVMALYLNNNPIDEFSYSKIKNRYPNLIALCLENLDVDWDEEIPSEKKQSGSNIRFSPWPLEQFPFGSEPYILWGEVAGNPLLLGAKVLHILGASNPE